MVMNDEIRSVLRIPYAMRRIPPADMASLLPCPEYPQPGDIALAQLERVGKNTRLELTSGRACTLHEGDLLAVVFGNRYATQQFEGYARTEGTRCDLLSMGGLCGLVATKHANVSSPTTLRLLGTMGDANGRPLQLRQYALGPVQTSHSPGVIVVCGSSMDAGKTHTAASLIVGLKRKRHRVAAIKLTGTAAGRDTWSLADAGACVALDFVDGGYPSTYLCSLEELLDLYDLLIAHAAANGAQWIVVEIADGLFQSETSALLQSPRFTSTVNAWVFATSDPLAAACGVRVLHGWNIEPIAISGLISLSPLGMREAENATGVTCLTASDLQKGRLNEDLMGTIPCLSCFTAVAHHYPKLAQAV